MPSDISAGSAAPSSSAVVDEAPDRHSLASVGVVTWNSADVLPRCLDALRAQTYSPIELLVVDNASVDGTWRVIERMTAANERMRLAENRGFSCGHNIAIRRTRGEFYLALNPDVFIDRDFVARLIAALDARPDAGSASGKLLRAEDPGVIDSTGLYMAPSQRHLDRGADAQDRGQYDQAEYVFGASGAAALYRRRMLDDVAVAGEIFDEDFFAYREDADLAWRAQLLGWRCVYEPTARALHVRRVTPERRGALPAAVNRWSVRNRFLLRLKNQTPRHARRFLGPALARDAAVIGYVILREWSSLPALFDVVRLAPRMWRKRRAIMRKRRVADSVLIEWFLKPSAPFTGTEATDGTAGTGASDAGKDLPAKAGSHG